MQIRSPKPKKVDVVLNSTEKFLNKCLKSAASKTQDGFGLLFEKVGTIVSPPPPYEEDIVYMTYIIKVDKQKSDWQKSIVAVLKKTKGVRDFKMDDRGRIIVSCSADLKLFLKGVAKASNAKLEYVQSGQCSSNLFVPPHIAMQGYGYGNGYGSGYGYGLGNSYYGNGGGMFPFHGGYGGGQQMGYGYSPMGYNHNYYGQGNMPFGYRNGMNYMEPQHQPFMTDERMTNCPCEF
ncbi:hypothetical protein LIER_17719 [Lithospermum erythrorhizon]|uniref:Uncharacterized protein n=1 Tax=Lithospermum erythrorhizon TaxID=34254 RepID=A0AAV3QEM5_LITER